MGIENLVAIIAKYLTAGDQVLLKSEIVDLASAIVEPLPRASVPPLTFVDAATVRVKATTDSPASLMMSGFPNIYNPMETTLAGLSDGGYRAVTSDVNMAFGAGDLWGTEKANQWYAIFAIAGNTDTVFTLKAMPYLKVKSQSVQTISLGTFKTPATGIGYGWDTDSLVGAKIYVLYGASKGLVRTISANNNDNTTGGTITYSGDPLTLAAGDVFIVLPATNFRRLGDVWNDNSSNLTQIDDLIMGKTSYDFMDAGTYDWTCPLICDDDPLASGTGAGAGGESSAGASNGGGAGDAVYRSPLTAVPGTYYLITVGTGGTPATAGTATSIGALLVLAGGARNGGGAGLVITDETGNLAYIGGDGQGGIFGTGGLGAHSTSMTAGQAGRGFGVGGGGGVLNGTGGFAGDSGFIRIQKY